MPVPFSKIKHASSSGCSSMTFDNLSSSGGTRVFALRKVQGTREYVRPNFDQVVRFLNSKQKPRYQRFISHNQKYAAIAHFLTLHETSQDLCADMLRKEALSGQQSERMLTAQTTSIMRSRNLRGQSGLSYLSRHDNVQQSMSFRRRPQDDRSTISATYLAPRNNNMQEGDCRTNKPNINHSLRRRRTRLPKYITETLTAWFETHLDFPYPTENEKQQLMHQTKLQMGKQRRLEILQTSLNSSHPDQISNWFINARRRKRPALTGTTPF